MKKQHLLLVLLFTFLSNVYAQDAFITKWNITSSDLDLTIPINKNYPYYTYNYNIDWGDGTTDTNVAGEASHTYAHSGKYSVTITDNFPAIFFYDKEQLIDVIQWGTTSWKSMHYSFFNCTNISTFSATDKPDLSTVRDMSDMFRGATSFNTAIDDWDVSEVTNMVGLFYLATSFNQDIGSWDVSAVTDMRGMFSGAKSFNQDIGDWDVSAVTGMGGMFSNAQSFNQDIGDWDVGTVTEMVSMFDRTTSFNQDIGDWDVSAVTAMDWMFSNTESFNQDIGAWNVSAVTNMSRMFSFTTSFNQDIGDWDVSSVTDMVAMFRYAKSFNQDIGDWDVSAVTNMTWMFNKSTLTTANYDALLEGWSKLDLKRDVNFEGGKSRYCNSVNERQKIIDDFGWNITDDGIYSSCSNLDAFITKWKIENDDLDLTIPVSSTGPSYTYNYNIDWGDGTTDANVTGETSHTYMQAGKYYTIITGVFPVIYFNEKKQLIDVIQWGTTQWKSMKHSFGNCQNLSTFSATDNPDLSAVTDMSGMFWDATSFNADIGAWDVSSVTHMGYMFDGAKSFNQDLGVWDVSNVATMEEMFWGATSFNQDIGNWDVSAVTNMSSMFSNAKIFNQDIGAWNVSTVTDMDGMFFIATTFNQDIGTWDVSNVGTMESMFGYATTFNQDLGAWDVSSVTRMLLMFDKVTLSTANYDALLEGWSKLDLKRDVGFYGGNSKYCSSVNERQKIIDDFGWIITDDGKDVGCPNLGIDDNLLSQGLTLFPNPTTDILVIESKLPIIKIEIYSYLGKRMKDVNANFNNIKIDHLVSGVYMVKIYSEKSIAYRKFIKE